MLPNAFVGKLEKPTDSDVADALGDARTLLDQLLARLASECGLTALEWGSSGKKYGWSIHVMAKKRRILYIGPHQGSFGVAFILGDRAVEAVRQSKLPKKLIQLVENGVRYPEGTEVRMEVGAARDLEAVVRLAEIKMKN